MIPTDLVHTLRASTLAARQAIVNRELQQFQYSCATALNQAAQEGRDRHMFTVQNYTVADTIKNYLMQLGFSCSVSQNANGYSVMVSWKEPEPVQEPAMQNQLANKTQSDSGTSDSANQTP